MGDHVIQSVPLAYPYLGKTYFGSLQWYSKLTETSSNVGHFPMALRKYDIVSLCTFSSFLEAVKSPLLIMVKSPDRVSTWAQRENWNGVNHNQQNRMH